MRRAKKRVHLAVGIGLSVIVGLIAGIYVARILIRILIFPRMRTQDGRPGIGFRRHGSIACRRQFALLDSAGA